jgi:hypothetical protein
VGISIPNNLLNFRENLPDLRDLQEFFPADHADDNMLLLQKFACSARGFPADFPDNNMLLQRKFAGTANKPLLMKENDLSFKIVKQFLMFITA